MADRWYRTEPYSTVAQAAGIISLLVAVEIFPGCTGQTPVAIAPNQANVELLRSDIENRQWE